MLKLRGRDFVVIGLKLSMKDEETMGGMQKKQTPKFKKKVWYDNTATISIWGNPMIPFLWPFLRWMFCCHGIPIMQRAKKKKKPSNQQGLFLNLIRSKIQSRDVSLVSLCNVDGETCTWSSGVAINDDTRSQCCWMMIIIIIIIINKAWGRLCCSKSGMVAYRKNQYKRLVRLRN